MSTVAVKPIEVSLEACLEFEDDNLTPTHACVSVERIIGRKLTGLEFAQILENTEKQRLAAYADGWLTAVNEELGLDLRWTSPDSYPEFLCR